MPSALRFPTPEIAADVLTFAHRASRGSDGAIRLTARDGTLSMTAAVLAPRTLLEPTPTIVGMRFSPVDPELICDLVVDAGTLGVSPDRPTDVALPDSAVTAAWAGVSAPRVGWERDGEVGSEVLADRARWGASAVARLVPATGLGEEAVHHARAEVWGEVDDDLAGLPRGVAFAADVLGFVGDAEQATIFRQGPWTRLSLTRGHVLVRTGVRSGLTMVRRTGLG